MDNTPTLMTEASGLRHFARFAQINGLQLRAFLSPDLLEIVELSETIDRVPAQTLVDVLELSAIVGQRPAIGIELANYVDMRTVGMLSVLLDACPNIGEALRVLAQYVYLESFALDSEFEQVGDEVMFRQMHKVQGQFGHNQFVEGSLLVIIRMLRMAAGESWSPLRVEFEHQPADDLRLHRTMFRCPLIFGASRNALFLPSEALLRPLPRGNAAALQYLERHIATLGLAHTGSLETEVARLIMRNLSEAKANLATVSKAMGLRPRALQRRLASEGLEFSAILTQVRKQVVENFVWSEHQPELTKLAFRLGYSESSNASRFLREQFGKGLRELFRDKQRAQPSRYQAS